MNKFLLITAILAATCISLAADAQVFAGLKGGLGLVTLNEYGHEGRSGLEYRSGISFPYSAFCHIPVSKRFSLQFELGHALLGGIKSGIYPLQNTRTSGADATMLYTDCPGETRLYYLTSAIMAGYSQPVSPICHAYIFVGGAPALLLKAQEISIGQGNLYDRSEGNDRIIVNKYFSETATSTNNYRSWNWSLTGRIGLRWEMDQEYFLIELSADKGLGPVQNDEGSGRNTTALYAFSVGYGFRM